MYGVTLPAVVGGSVVGGLETGFSTSSGLKHQFCMKGTVLMVGLTLDMAHTSFGTSTHSWERLNWGTILVAVVQTFWGSRSHCSWGVSTIRVENWFRFSTNRIPNIYKKFFFSIRMANSWPIIVYIFKYIRIQIVDLDWSMSDVKLNENEK